MITQLFSNKSDYPKNNAQDNLCGRTHYVDDDSLRFHKSRVVSARAVYNGLLFAIVTSDALDMNNSKRGFRFAVFDLFGKVLDRTPIDGAFRTRAQAEKAMWAFVNTVDAKAHTHAAIAQQQGWMTADLERLADVVDKLEA